MRDAFGRGKWDQPIQIAGLLDGLIALNRDLLANWKREKPGVAWFSDPAGTWANIDKQLRTSLNLLVYWRDEVGRVTQWDNPDAIAETVLDPLLYGNWTFYEETGLPYPPGANKHTLPVAGLPYNAGIQMDAVVIHNAQILEKWVTEDVPASVLEGIETLGKVATAPVRAVSTATGSGLGVLGETLGRLTTLSPVTKIGLGLLLYLALANADIVPTPRKLFKGER
jgi:hypothetical protein